MTFRQTKSQVARGAFADAETDREIHLFKDVSRLRPTYQVRLLLYRATEEGKRLFLHVPKHCEFEPMLKKLLAEYPKAVRVVKV